MSVSCVTSCPSDVTEIQEFSFARMTRLRAAGEACETEPEEDSSAFSFFGTAGTPELVDETTSGADCSVVRNFAFGAAELLRVRADALDAV